MRSAMVKRLKIVFMGTPDFAVGALQAIIEAGHQVSAVVTQPERTADDTGEGLCSRS